MKANRPSNIIVAALFAAVWFGSQLAAQAVTLGPYTADTNTLHLYHMDVANVPVPDAVPSGGV